MIPWHDLVDIYNHCSAVRLDQLHSAALATLYAFGAGDMPIDEFARYFSLPDSHLVPVGKCIVKMLTLTRGA
jgi:hypothetical protein